MITSRHNTVLIEAFFNESKCSYDLLYENSFHGPKQFKQEIISEIESQKPDTNDQNEYFCPDFIEFLLESFMPYAFIWCSFALKGINNNITRLTNGLVENNIIGRMLLGPAQVKQFIDFQNKIDYIVVEQDKLNETDYASLKDDDLEVSNDERENINDEKSNSCMLENITQILLIVFVGIADLAVWMNKIVQIVNEFFKKIVTGKIVQIQMAKSAKSACDF
ncbi:unnamed protein product [Brachionus calyciflorus]|uniref:Uncharacterized protein n=1 Tax=Brachionus calyciflorus TaxID=104777 RepID=A0A813QH30_9BILA|nr:unnamed protein product [Brachionus calyciflorus]